MAAFAALAVLLAAVGIYGVISYTVVQRIPEIGVRSALGASRREIARMVLADGMRLALSGLAVGLAGALVLTRLLATLIVGVGARDPLTLSLAAAVLAAASALACYLPARRAARLDPLVAIRG